MSDFLNIDCTAFQESRCVALGALEHVVLKVKGMIDQGENSPILIFKDTTSEQIEVDFRGTASDVLKRLADHPDAHDAILPLVSEKPVGVGRPKLGVVAGEITLLPRHWEWLKSQPGGASVTIRKLVDEARRDNVKKDDVRKAQETTYRFMAVMAGNRDYYEEALRALYARDAQRFHQLIDSWPADIRNHINKLAVGVFNEIIALK